MRGAAEKGADRPGLGRQTRLGISTLLIILIALASVTCVDSGAMAQTLDRIAATKTLRIGFVADQPPFSSKGSDGAPRGYAIDLCGQVVQEIGRHIKGLKQAYVETTPADAFDAMAADRFDLLCGALTITLGRREKVDFSQPIFVTGMSALLRPIRPETCASFFSGSGRSPPSAPWNFGLLLRAG